MKKNWYSILPWISLVSGILVVLLITAAIIFKPNQNIENTANRKIAIDKLKQVSLEHEEQLNSKAFFDYVDKSVIWDVANTVWIIDEKGEIVYAKGMMAASTPLNVSVYSLIDDQSRGLINAVEGNLDALQKQTISIAAAIRREGEHNDVYGHLVVPLKTNRNELAGFIGIAYSLSNSEPPFSIYAIGFALFICFLAYWLSIPVWVYFDSRKNNEKSLLWTIFVLIGNLPAYIAYLISKK